MHDAGGMGVACAKTVITDSLECNVVTPVEADDPPVRGPHAEADPHGKTGGRGGADGQWRHGDIEHHFRDQEITAGRGEVSACSA